MKAIIIIYPIINDIFFLQTGETSNNYRHFLKELLIYRKIAR
ncbi:hypothetical protein AB11_2242 [Escherichia coli 1-176-05_S1_C1]|nr:hypothetical protein AB11_2242 [Escherichia coli 1-176-05_S1_C1]